MTLAVLIPAHNEADYIGPCLASVLGSAGPDRADIVVAANGCTDDTVRIARGYADAARARGWTLTVLDLPDGGKPGALNAADAATAAPIRVYVDADVGVDADLLPALATALDTPAARFCSGTPRVPRAGSAVTRAYARFWTRLPFVAHGVPGFGVFAVNASGRARWGAFPDIISDDTFVRLHFAPSERVAVGAGYTWPMAEGFRRLVRVRRRQDIGVAEVERLYPEAARNHDKVRTTPGLLLRRALSDPLGAAAYVAVALAVRLGPETEPWARGR